MLSAARFVADEVEGLAFVDRAAHRRLAARACDGKRLAGQRRLVEQRHAARHHAVDGKCVALPDHQPVAGHDRRYVDVLDVAVRIAMRDPRHAREKRRHLAPRAPPGVALQELPAGIHQPDDNAGKRFVKGEGGAHGEPRDQVEPHFAAPQAGDCLKQKRGERRRDPDIPDRRAGGGMVECDGNEAARERAGRDSEEPAFQEVGCSGPHGDDGAAARLLLVRIERLQVGEKIGDLDVGEEAERQHFGGRHAVQDFVERLRRGGFAPPSRATSDRPSRRADSGDRRAGDTRCRRPRKYRGRIQGCRGQPRPRSRSRCANIGPR